MWLARDNGGFLYGFENKLIRDKHGWVSIGWVIQFPSFAFPEIKWEDEEPRELILK